MGTEEILDEKDTKNLPVKKRYLFTFLAVVAALITGYLI